MQEIEIKLAFFPDHEKSILSGLNKVLGPAIQSRELNNRYFDTPDMALRRQKWSLRIREAGDYTEQTVKGKGSVVAGLHSRLEKNWPLQYPVLAPDKLAEIPELAELAVDQLQEAFQTRFNRTEWLWQQQDSQIEVVLDRGVIDAANSQCAIAEIELEIKQGTEPALMQLATAIVNTIPCWLLSASKAQRGYSLFSQQKPFLALSDMADINSVTDWVDYFGIWASSTLVEGLDELAENQQPAAAALNDYEQLLLCLAGLADGLHDAGDGNEILQCLVRAAVDELNKFKTASRQDFSAYLTQSTLPGRLGMACIESAVNLHS